MIDEQVILDVLDRIRHRQFGKYKGTVVDVDEKTMRIKAKVPAVFGETPTGWCRACVPYAGKQVGIAFLPEVGSGVWIEFEGGELSMPIWSGCYWRDDEYPEDAKAAVKVIVTKSKQKIILDDDAGTIVITDDHKNKVTLDSSGITAEREGKKIAITTSKVSVNDTALEVT